MDGGAVVDEAREAGDPGLVERLVRAAGGRAGADVVFGAPVERGSATVIPVARVRWGAGGGGGSAPEQGEGSGGGAGAVADPVGYIEMTADGVTFREIARPWASPVTILAAALGLALVLRALAKVLR